mmetsp:Transcript_964/g.2277  ORF Transcript_964/g.2277 Transcript_964/m.2277 type:complete len:657 (+) Transcript_964:756-2726(+)
MAEADMMALPASAQMQKRIAKRKVWREVVTNEGPSYKNHTATLVGNKIYVFGGYDGRGNHNDVYEFNCIAKRWRKIEVMGEAPKGRNGHTATYAEQKIFIVGGWLGSGPLAASDLHILEMGSLMRWHSVQPLGNAPGPCNMHTTDFVPEKRSLFVFRGGDGSQYLNDLHLLNIDTFEWTQPDVFGAKPAARANHSSALVGRKLYVFGGWDGRQRLNDIHILDTDTLTWSQPQVHGHPPSPRAGMTFTCVRDKIYLFGGSGPQATCYKDLQVFDPATNTWLLVTEGRGESKSAGLEDAYPNIDRDRISMSSSEYEASGLPGLYNGSGIGAGASASYGSKGKSKGTARVTSHNRGMPSSSSAQQQDSSGGSGANPNSVSLGADIYVVGKGPSERAGHTATLVDNKLIVFGGSCVDDYLQDMSMLDVDEPPTVCVESYGGPLQRLEGKLKSFINNRTFSDVTFVVEGKKLYANKLVLALTSERFELMFCPREDGTQFREAVDREIRIDDVSFNVFHDMIEYLYTGDLRAPFVLDLENKNGRPFSTTEAQSLVEMYVDEAAHRLILTELPADDGSTVPLKLDEMRYLQEMLVCADRFMLDHLKQLCERQLVRFIAQSTVKELEYTSLETNAAQLHMVCQHFQRQVAHRFQDADSSSRHFT